MLPYYYHRYAKIMLDFLANVYLVCFVTLRRLTIVVIRLLNYNLVRKTREFPLCGPSHHLVLKIDRYVFEHIAKFVHI